MFDVIGKRRWFYIFSLAITIPGLVFILLTPFTDAGLQFTIDYTGGTKWEIRFEDASVTPDQVEAVFAKQGLEATAVSTGSGFIEIKTDPAGRLPRGRPVRRAVRRAERLALEPSGSPAAQRLAGPERERQPGAERLTRAQRFPGAQCIAVGAAGRRQHADPDPGHARRGRDRAPG